MNFLKGLSTLLAAIYIGLMSIAFFAVGATGTDESLRVSAIWLGATSGVITIMLIIPFIASAYKDITGGR